MLRRTSLLLFAIIALLVVLVVAMGTACSTPLPPRITPKEAKVTAVGPQGVQVLVTVEALNPNSVTLSVQSMTGKAKLDGKYDLGTVTVAKPITLPSNVPTLVDVPMTLPWADLQTLAAVASANRPVPYVIDGSVAVGGERINVNVPFSISGTITSQQLAGAVMKGLPPGLPAIPGLTLPH